MIKILYFSLLVYLITAFYPPEPYAKNVTAPSVNCEIRNSVWCIADGAYSIKRELATDSVNDRIWTIGDYFKPEYKLIVLEPNGCKSGYANQTKLLSIEPNYVWNNTKWNRAFFKLKSGNDCNLTLLFSLPTYDTSKWTYPLNLELIRPCTNVECHDESLARFMPQLKSAFVNSQEKKK